MRSRQLLVVVAVLVGSLATTPVADAGYVGRNGRIAFVRANQIYTMWPNGTGVLKLTSIAKNYRPKWSPDGKRIAFIHEASPTSKEIWLMNGDGMGKSRVTRVGAVTGATWSPNGSKIAFGGRACGQSTPTDCQLELQTIGTTAPYGSPTVLQASSYDGDPGGSTSFDVGDVIGPPAWSPDGQEITFASHNFPDSPDQYVLIYNLRTQDIHEQDGIGGACCGFGSLTDPQYSPGGATLTVTLRPQGIGGKIHPSRIRSEFGAPVPTLDHDQDATFSPDGNRIAVTNDAGGTPAIVIQPSTGTSRIKVTAGYQPDWQSLH